MTFRLQNPRKPSSRPAARRSLRQGFSLLEILVVLAIIALIAAVVGPRLFAQLDRSKTTAARIQAKAIKGALETMRIDIGRLPSQQEGLNLLIQADATTVPGWQGPYMDALPSDPWGRPYVYMPPADAGAAGGLTGGGAASVLSYGADGQEGGEGVNADVSSEQQR